MRLIVPKDEPPRSAGAGDGAGAARGPRNVTRPGRALGRARRTASSSEGSGVPASELAERRERLAAQFAELQWDLGGLVYEMAARDHFRLDVVVRRAARLQEVDAELAEIERLLRLEEGGAAGECPACGALYARGAVYCWRCGKDLMAKATASTEPAPTPTETVAAKVRESSGPG